MKQIIRVSAAALSLIIFITATGNVYAGKKSFRSSGKENAVNAHLKDGASLSDKDSDALFKKFEKLQQSTRNKSVQDKITALKNKKTLQKSKKEAKGKNAKQDVTSEDATNADLKAINDELKKNWDAQVSSLTATEKSAVEFSEPNYVLGLDDAYVPNDAPLDTEWQLKSILAQNSALFTTTPTLTRPVIVAVIDAGVDYTHEDLKGSMWKSDRCSDDAGLLLPQSCANGYDFVQGDYDPFPSDGFDHGTAVASLVGAGTDNGLGLAPLSQNRVKIMSLRVADQGVVDLNAAVRAIRFAVNNGADIINMSLGGPTFSQSLQDSIQYAQDNGVTIVTSSGNLGNDLDSIPQYPASYTNPNVITVAAIDKTGQKPSWSSYGSVVDVAAPGSSVYTASNANMYRTYSGTSFSTPIVTSLIARGISEGKTPAQTIAAIPDTAGVANLPTKILGKAIAATDGTVYTSPYIRLPNGKLYNIFSRDGEVLSDGFTLNLTGNSIASNSFGIAQIKSPVCTTVGGNTTSLPSSISVVGTAPYSARFSWDAVTGATKYAFYLKTVNEQRLFRRGTIVPKKIT